MNSILDLKIMTVVFLQAEQKIGAIALLVKEEQSRVSTSIKKLYDLKLLKRKRADRRTNLYSITAKGRKALAKEKNYFMKNWEN